MKTYGYGKDDNAFERLIQYGVLADNIVIDENYFNLKTRLHKDDTLMVEDIYVLGKNKKEVKQQLCDLQKINVRLKVIDMPTTLIEFKTNDIIAKMLLGTIIETLDCAIKQDADLARKRQRDGIERAKAEGKFNGRPPLSIDWERFGQLYEQWEAKKITGVEFQKQMGLRANTFYRKLHDYQSRLKESKPKVIETTDAFLKLLYENL